MIKNWKEVKFDGKLGYYRPLDLSVFIVFSTKKEAFEYATDFSIPKNFTTKIGSRFYPGWGFMDSHGRFLLL